MFVNLTPHALQVFDLQGNFLVTLPPSGQVARCKATTSVVAIEEGIPLLTTVFGTVEGLPEPLEGTTYVVSLLIRSALPNRTDLASPGELLRDSAGQPLGCKGLAVNR